MKRIRFPLPVLAILLGAIGGALFIFIGNRTSPILGLIAICGLIFAAVLVRYPNLSFLLLAAVVPLERLGRFTPDTSTFTISLMRLLGVLALGSFLLNAAARKQKVQFGAPFFLYLAYASVAMVSMFYTGDLRDSVRTFAPIAGNLLFFFVIINMARDWKVAKGAVCIWLAVTVILGAYTIYDWHSGSRGIEMTSIGNETANRFRTIQEDQGELLLERTQRAAGPTSHSAVYGINLILTVPFFFYLLRSPLSVGWQVLVYVGLLIVFYNILLTNTRAAILLVGGVVVLCSLYRLLVLKPWKIMVAILAVGAIAPLVSQKIVRRVLDVSNYTYSKSSTLQIRIEYWKAGLQIARENWLTGVGIGFRDMPKYIKGWVPEEASTHLEYLQTLVELGIFGWIFLFSFVGLLLWYAVRAAAILRRCAGAQECYWFMVACQIAMISVLLYGLQCDVFHFPLKGWWLTAGLTFVMHTWACRAQLGDQDTGLGLRLVPPGGLGDPGAGRKS